MKLRILFIAFFVSALSWGQISENIQSWTNHAGYGAWTQVIPAGTVTMTQCIVANAAAATGTCSAGRIQMQASTGIVQLPTLATVGTFEVHLAAGAAGRTLALESFDGTVWNNLTTFTAIGTVGATYTFVINSATPVTLRLASPSAALYAHDIIVTTLTAVPTLTLTPATLSGLTYVVGSGPSAEQTFTVSGANLTANAVLNAPTNYEISTTSGSGFGPSVTLVQSGGVLTGQPVTIYVRLKSGLSVNSYTGNITADSTGATQKTVALSGSVTGSLLSDLVAVSGSEAASISSTINNNAPLTSVTGVQVWQFKVRDGGASLNDPDNLPTILNAFTMVQSAGNAVGTWTDAINTIALFDGATFIATGTVTATNITFSGLNISVADNTEKTLSIRLSLKCPLGADAFDGEDFGFSVSNANTTFSATGSGKFAFPAITTLNGADVIQVVATNLVFTVQPQTTGVNGAMGTAVLVTAKDACGNVDTGFTGVVSLTSSGTMSGTPILNSAVNGVATFSSITHTVVATGLTLTAASAGLTSATSTAFDILNITTLKPGDLGILAFNTDINGDGSGIDEVSFVTFVDVLPGTTIDMTDNAYQKCGTPNGWGISEGWIRLVRTNSTLLKGTIITVRVTSGTPSVFSPDPSNWACSKPQPVSQGTFDLNNGGEQIFFMSGGNVGGLNATTAASDAGTYSGYFLFGFNTKGNIWTPVCGNAGAGGTKNSDKPVNFDCFLTWPTIQADLNKYTGLLSPASQRDWIARIADPNNWTGYADTVSYAAGPDFYGGSISIIAAGYSNGVWIGNKSTNWFECGNWQSLRVPDETVNVVIDANATQKATVDYTAPFSDYYLDIAKTKDLTITNQKLELFGSANNVIEIHGNLTIGSSGSLDMDDSNSGTTDGQIQLYGNWTNTVGSVAFEEGNGSVKFTGVSPQIINNVTPEGTETFYNLELNNDFDTAVSNNIIATNNILVNTGKTLIVNTNNYAEADKNFTNNGIVTIEDTGALYQVDDSGVDSGNISMKRNASIKKIDYVYWSSPVSGFNVNAISPGTPSNLIWKWNPIIANPNGGEGFWVAGAGDIMAPGKGYIVRGPNSFTYSNQTFTATFNNGIPNNGVVNQTINRGSMTAATLGTFTSLNGVPFTVNDDNWNLVGNPYPSAISANTFLQYNSITNPVIEGAVRIWTHGTLPVSTINPFYDSYAYNYTANDYITYNGTATTSGPAGFNGYIGAGQGFLVLMNEGTAGSSTLTFNNSMRVKGTNDNIQFFRNTNETTSNSVQDNRHRIWLDLINATGNVVRTVVGYVPNASNDKDVMYDAFTKLDGNQNFYSLINTDLVCIQGRSVPFDVNDQVPLGFATPIAGEYTIAIGTVDGLFEGNQNIYLEDKNLNVIYDLKQAPYNFTTASGVFNERFVLRYTNVALNTDNLVLDNSIVVVSNENQIAIKSSSEKISSVIVYDVLGRQIAEKNNIGENETILYNIDAKNQGLIVKIQLENGQIITKKVIL